MAQYTVLDSVTGKKITFEWNSANPPSDNDMTEIFAESRKSESEQPIEQQSLGKEIARTVAKALPAAGAGLGGILAGPANLGAPGIAEAAGIGLGYMAGKRAERIVNTLIGDEKSGTLPQELKETVRNILPAAETGLAGPIFGKAIGGILKASGEHIAKPILGRLSGLGSKSVTEAVKSGEQLSGINILKSQTAFDKAMRGKISGQDIVDNAREALYRVKDARTSTYQAQLENIATRTKDIDTTPVISKLLDLMKRYNVKMNTDGTFDISRIAMGKSGRKDIAEILNTVSKWGSKKGDNTALGLDVLKRQLDDFYSESSQARAFVTQIRNSVKDTIIKSVPEYSEMTSGYAEATNMIKDIEAGLMLRKQGMTGRIIADQTLRKLMSSMKDNFALRGELVEILGNNAAKDLSSQIAGYGMRSTLPVGIAGTGPVLIGESVLIKFVNPHWWPTLLASSPRVQGEFLRLFGKALAESAGAKYPIANIASGAFFSNQNNIENELQGKITKTIGGMK